MAGREWKCECGRQYHLTPDELSQGCFVIPIGRVILPMTPDEIEAEQAAELERRYPEIIAEINRRLIRGAHAIGSQSEPPYKGEWVDWKRLRSRIAADFRGAGWIVHDTDILASAMGGIQDVWVMHFERPVEGGAA